jgi:hypothetical protein
VGDWEEGYEENMSLLLAEKQKKASFSSGRIPYNHFSYKIGKVK